MDAYRNSVRCLGAFPEKITKTLFVKTDCGLCKKHSLFCMFSFTKSFFVAMSSGFFGMMAEAG